MLVAQSCLTLGDPMDYSPPGSSVQEILQARILVRVAILFSRGSSHPGSNLGVLHCRQMLCYLTTREALAYRQLTCWRPFPRLHHALSVHSESPPSALDIEPFRRLLFYYVTPCPRHEASYEKPLSELVPGNSCLCGGTDLFPPF